jgi:hypothetical protein
MEFETADTPVSALQYPLRTRFFRLQKVGYAERTGRRAVDSRGFEYEVLDLHILGTRYAIRLEDLARAIAEHGAVRIEEITREWRSYLGAACGLAQVSVSKKGLNIELFDGGQYTTPLAALLRVIESRERYAPVARIPGPSLLLGEKDRRIFPEQQRLSAFA